MILFKSSYRYLRKHYIQSLLAILGIALGIAITVSIDLAISSSQKAFELSASRISGKASHQLIASNGEDFPEVIYTKLKTDIGIDYAAPVVESYIEVIDPSSSRLDNSTAISKNLSKIKTLHLLGIDPFAEKAFRDIKLETSKSSKKIWEPNSCFISQDTASSLNLKLNDTFWIRSGSLSKPLRLAGYITDPDSNYESLLIMDIASAQDLLNKTTRLSYIDLILNDKQVNELKNLFPEAELVESSNRSKSLSNMTEAFNLNLTALSFLALMVAVFLIYNSVSFSVVQRRKVLGILRAIGVSRRQIITMVITEAFIFASVGTALGLILGLIFGRLVLDLVLQTINDIYFTLEIKNYNISSFSLIKGALLGYTASVAAALIPAWDAARSSPVLALSRSGFESKSKTRTKVFFIIGLGLMLMGFGIIKYLEIPNSKGIIESFVALFLVLIGFAFCTLLLIEFFCFIIRPIIKVLFGFPGVFAVNSITNQISRTSVAVAALMIAISVSIGLNITIQSFRATVVNWLDNSLKADIYISSPRLVSSKAGKALEPDFINSLFSQEKEFIKDYISYRNIDTSTSLGKIQIASIKTTDFVRSILAFKTQEQKFWDKFKAEDKVVLASEPFINYHHLKLGDSFKLKTPAGEVKVKIGAVFYDYGSERGLVMLAEPLYQKLYQDMAISSIGLIVKNKNQINSIIEDIKAKFSDKYSLFIRSNQKLKEESMQIFDRTFKVTYVLKFIAISVAFIAVLSAFMALQLERIKEFAILKASGMRSNEITKTLTIQTLIMGLFAAIFAIPAGILQALIMIYVINQRSFGWSMDLIIKNEFFYEAFIYAGLASLLAVIYPAWINSQMKISEVLRNE